MEQQEEFSVNEVKKRRPVFLTVLCILSFAGIAYVITTSLLNIIQPSKAQLMLEKFAAMGNPLLASLNIGKFLQYSEINNIISIIAALICLAGVVFMWKLKRMGFYIYAAGEIIPSLATFFLFWNFFDHPLMSLAFMISAVLMLLLSIAFLIMYAMNLKHMS